MLVLLWPVTLREGHDPPLQARTHKFPFTFCRGRIKTCPAVGTNSSCVPMRIRNILRFYDSALSHRVSGRIYPAPTENKTPTRFRVSGFMLALPIFPGSRPPSIVGACELNFCVRDGNRWTLTAINTNSFGRVAPSFMSKLLQAPTAFGL